MLTDEQFQALQEYVWSKGFGGGWRLDTSVLNDKYTDFLVVEGLIKPHDKSGYFRITELGETVYWLNSYHRLKEMIYQTADYTKLMVIEAKDTDALKNALQGVLMLLSGSIQFRDGFIQFQDKSVLPADFTPKEKEENE